MTWKRDENGYYRLRDGTALIATVFPPLKLDPTWFWATRTRCGACATLKEAKRAAEVAHDE